MATRRMFSKSVVLGDDFLDLSNEAKLLYFLLGLDADDDGFLKSSKRICKVNDIEESTLDELENKDFIIRFSSGVICITDWCRNNQIQKDRYHPTEFTEMALVAKDKASRYRVKGVSNTVCIQPVPNMDTTCKQNSYNMDTEDSIGKNSIGKGSLGKGSVVEEREDHIQPLSGKPDGVEGNEWEKIQTIISYLNQKAMKHFQPTAKETKKLILQRFKEGFTVEDFKTAIDKKCNDWLYSEYDTYLRPSTLFGDNFESYVNQLTAPPTTAKPPLPNQKTPLWILEAFGKELDDDEKEKFTQLAQQYGESTMQEALNRLIELRKKNSTLDAFGMDYLVSMLNVVNNKKE